MTILSSKEALNFLTCPFCFKPGKTTLRTYKDGLQCKICKRKYIRKNNILQFIDITQLDKEAQRELKGNKITLTKENIDHYSNKDKWGEYFYHYVNKKFTYLMEYLNQIEFKGIASLGSGPGFEIKEILKRKHVNLFMSSDIAFTATSIVPTTLKDFELKLLLFTSDLNKPPVMANEDIPILIYEAIHHTGTIHLTIENLMKRKYRNLLFVEPTTNFLVKLLSIAGIAQRVEYSGLKPDFLDVAKLEKLAKRYKYELKIKTLWDIPEDYFRIICKNKGTLQNFFLFLIDTFSYLSNIFKFGSFSVVWLKSRSKK